MLSLIFLVLSVACGLAVIYPYLIYPLLLRLLPKRLLIGPVGSSSDASAKFGTGVPRFSILICAHNEESVLECTLARLRAARARYPAVEILIYSDASTDRTNEILRGDGDLVRPVVAAERRGKSHGMNLLAAEARGETLVFMDANVEIGLDSLAALERTLGDPSVGCVAGTLTYVAPETATASVSSLFWRLEEHIKALESASGSAMGATGGLFAVRRALYPHVPPDIIDDMFVSFSVLCGGARVVSAKDFSAVEEAAASPGEEFKRKVRIACQAYNCHRYLRDALRRLGPIDRFKYFSHKLVRWHGIFFLAFGGLFGLAAVATSPWPVPLALGLIAVALLLVGLECAGLRSLSRFSAILYALVATGLGRLQADQGYRYQTWQPPSRA